MWTSLPAYCCSHLIVPLRMLSPPAAGAVVPPAVVPPAAGAVVPPAVVPPAAGAVVPPVEAFLSSPQAATRRPTRQSALKAPFRDFMYFPLRNRCTSKTWWKIVEILRTSTGTLACSSSQGKSYARLPANTSADMHGGPVATITLDDIDKIYDNGFQAVTGLSLEIDDGEFLVLVGPSGCGKSTALRMIAGLESISGGELRIGQRVVNNLEPKDRDIAMVFQSYALYPHLTVRDNIAFALKLQKVPKDEIDRRVADAARTLELTDNLDRRPAQLSGGQRQRVAMGRAIVRQPQAFLMDEPLSNLDAKLRVQMRAEIAKIQHDLNTTTVYVTHDQIEAMTMGDRVAVMSKGTLMQVDSPQTLYDRPDNLFVAAFIGSPQMNLLRGSYQANGSGGTLRLGSAIIALSSPPSALAAYSGRDIAVGLRPEHLTEAAAGEHNTISGKVTVREGLGSEVILHLDVDCHGVDTEAVRDAMEGESTGQSITARLPPHTGLRIDDTAHLVVDPAQLHLFDLDTSLAIR